MTDASLETYSPRTRPLKALAALWRFLRDKEATHEFFRIVAALDGPVGEQRFQRFAATELGARVLAEKIELRDALGDREALAALPEGSLGRAYLAFITHENLSAEGLQAEMDATGERFSRAGPDRRRYIYRVRHSHDLFHVLTGYGRDFVGELAILAFTRAQTGSRALRLVIAAGLFKGWREYPGLPVLACVREGARLGRAAGDLLTADWEALLALPLPEVRRRLKIGVPARYLAVQSSADAVDRRYRERLALQAA